METAPKVHAGPGVEGVGQVRLVRDQVDLGLAARPGRTHTRVGERSVDALLGVLESVLVEGLVGLVLAVEDCLHRRAGLRRHLALPVQLHLADEHGRALHDDDLDARLTLGSLVTRAARACAS